MWIVFLTLFVLFLFFRFLYKSMGNTLDGLVYRLKNNDVDLTEINCADEGIPSFGDDGALEFASALAVNKTLTFLDLNGMNIRDDGAAKLANALFLNDTLTLIRLHRNKIGDEGARKLEVALRHNHTVTTLFLQMNAIKTREIEKEIQELIAMNKEGPEKAEQLKAAAFGSEWAAEGARLKRKAQEELIDYSEKKEEHVPLLSGQDHQKTE